MVSTVEPAPSRCGDGGDDVVVGERRRGDRQVPAQQVGDPLVGGDDPFVVLGPAVLVEADVGQPPHLVDADRAAWLQLGDQGVGLRRPPPPLFGFLLPAGVEPFAFPFRLVPPGRQHRGLLTRPGPSAVPVASSHASISARRFENWSTRPWGTPAISGTCRPGRHSTPRVRVSSARNAAWNTSPAARAAGTGRGGRTPTTARRRPRRGWRPARASAAAGPRRGWCDAGTPPPPPPTSSSRCGPIRRCVPAGGDQLGPLLVDPRHVVRAPLHLDRFALQPADRLARRRGRRRR